MNMKKFSKKLISYGAFCAFFASLFVFWFILLEFLEDENSIIDLKIILLCSFIAIVVFVLIMIYLILFYKLSGYELNETQIICKRGVLFKRKSMLDYSKINSINKRQGIIQKLFGISTLLVDSGSTTRSHQAEIMIIENTKVVEELYSKLKSIDKANPYLALDDKDKSYADLSQKKENLYEFNSKSKIIYTFVNSIINLFLSIFVFLIMFTILYLLYLFPEENEEPITLTMVIAISISVYGLILLGGILVNLFKAFIGYYNFKITKINNMINVEYGLFVNNQNSFDLSKVRGVIISQGIFQRLFKLATIKVEVIGYVDNTNNNNNYSIGVLIPLCRINDASMYLENIIPSHIPVKQNSKSKAFFPFVSWNTLIALIALVLCLIPSIFISIAYNSYLALIISTSIIVGIFVIYELILLLNSIFKFYNQDITFDNENITIYNGGFIKSSTIIKKSNIIAIEDYTTSYRAKKRIYTYIIHFHTNALSNTKKVSIVDSEFKEKLLSCMKY